MKKTILTASIALASSTSMANGYIDDSQVRTTYYGTLDKTLHHVQSSLNEDRSRIIANEQWNDRQEGVIRQNRGRLDENDAMNRRQNDSIDNAHLRIGGVQEDLDRNWSRTENAHARIDRETYKRNELQSESRAGDQRLGAEIATVDTNSRERDYAMSRQAQANMNWSIEQFNRQGRAISDVQAGVDANRQAIASERAERKQQGREANAGIASAASIGMHHFDTNYQGLQLSVSAAGYRGEHAQSLSAGGAITESVFGSVAVSHDSRGNQTYGVQSTFKF